MLLIVVLLEVMAGYMSEYKSVRQADTDNVIASWQFSELAKQTLLIEGLKDITLTLWRDRLSKDCSSVPQELRCVCKMRVYRDFP